MVSHHQIVYALIFRSFSLLLVEFSSFLLRVFMLFARSGNSLSVRFSFDVHNIISNEELPLAASAS